MTKTLTAILAGALLVSATPAHAYLDPGTGSLVLQALIAGVAAAGILFRRYLHRLVRLVGFRSRTNEEPDGPATAQDQPDD